MSVFCCFGASEPRAQEFDSEGNELPTAAPAAGAAPEPREDEGLQRVDPVIRSAITPELSLPKFDLASFPPPPNNNPLNGAPLFLRDAPCAGATSTAATPPRAGATFCC